MEAKKDSRIGTGTYYPDHRFYLFDHRTIIARSATIVSPYRALTDALEKTRGCLATRNYAEAARYLQEAEEHTHNFFDAAGKWQRTAEELAKTGLDTMMAILSATTELLRAIEHPASLTGRLGNPPLDREQSTPAPQQHGEKPSRKSGRGGSRKSREKHQSVGE